MKRMYKPCLLVCTLHNCHCQSVEPWVIKYLLVCTISPLAPTGAPQGLSVQNVMATSVVLTWNELDCLLQNGDITGYMIRYVRDSQPIADSSSTRTYTVQELIPFTEYSFSVAAVNSVGTGPFSEQSMTISTPESSECRLLHLSLTRDMHIIICIDSCLPFTQLLV